ncbi:glycine receptor subunit alpha-2 [Lingula anatina]|uniref:Glycine receptor subunit alpha-2 n=1 Tax=Lingula anatina TaxID=7574 RepID=A0A2R2MJQ8_LINAN|nr:glycine receptor subunit alpha-2 [Lingula anatina]|eukprot:XP_023930444.1 glycine receptor subunit alpha-2 [Lingula anatina]
MRILIFVALLYISEIFGIKQPRNNQTISEFLDDVLEGYDKLRPPLADESTRVELGVYVNSFYSISEQAMDFSVNIYLRQNWTDPRLAFEPNEDLGIGQMLKMDEHFWEKIWVPDVFFRNEKKANFHHVTIPNRLMRLYSNGQVWYVLKISATLDCTMALYDYPLDTQQCPLMMESFGNNMDTLHFVWMEKAVERDPNLSLPEYTLHHTNFSDCSQNYTAGEFPCLRIDFYLKRDRFFHVVQTYVPSALIVIMSWVGFWISIDASPARVSIGLLTVLTITTQTTAARASQPRVSYIKAIDVWLAACLLFVFGSLLEYSLVNTYSRRRVPTAVNRPRKTIVRNSCFSREKKTETCCEDVEEIQPVTPKKECEQVDPQGRERAKRVDKISRFLFPTAFLLFCLSYSIRYGVFSPREKD